MTEICDCHGADKAYAIINPDSPDRKEILSLNPPICKKINTNGLSINGEIFAGKEIEPSNPYTINQATGDGIRVDWGNGEVDILTGDDFSSTALFGWFCFRQGRPLGETWLTCKPNPCWSFPNRGLNGLDSDPSSAWIAVSAGGGDYRLRRNGVNAGRCDGATQFSVCGGATNHIFSFENYGHIVTSNTGDKSSRYINGSNNSTLTFGVNEPFVEVLSSDCALTINYAGGSTFDYGEIPCDAEIFFVENIVIFDESGQLYSEENKGQEIKLQCGDRQCPPETCCNPCEGKALNCCYDENGKLIDSFIRRT